MRILEMDAMVTRQVPRGGITLREITRYDSVLAPQEH
jgi:hypothetical protein